MRLTSIQNMEDGKAPPLLESGGEDDSRSS